MKTAILALLSCAFACAQSGSRDVQAEVLNAEDAFCMAGEVAVVSGSQAEVNSSGESRFQFVRVYIRRAGR